MLKGHETKKKEKTKKKQSSLCVPSSFLAIQLHSCRTDQSCGRKVSSSDISSACCPSLVVLLFGIDVRQVCFNRGAAALSLAFSSPRTMAVSGRAGGAGGRGGLAQINANCSCLPLACYGSPLRTEQC